MLSLSLSTKPCLPERKQVIDPGSPRPTTCETCGAPGGKDGELLERHIVANGKSKFICPICHHCLHLDFAGMKKSGRIIWLPDLSQETLNLLSLAMFLVVRDAAKAPAKPAATAKTDADAAAAEQPESDVDHLLAHAKTLYSTFRRRAEHVEVALGGNVQAMERLVPKSYLSEPQHIASLMAYAKKSSGLSERQMAQRVHGLRFLPNPNYFARYTDAVYALSQGAFPVGDWMKMVADFREAERQRLEAMPEESFDAQGVAQFAEPPMEEAFPAEPEPESAPEPA